MATAGARTGQVIGANGTQVGDPVRAAQAIMTAVEASEPPLHLALGAPAVEVARAKYTTAPREVEAWAALSLSADFRATEHTATAHDVTGSCPAGRASDGRGEGVRPVRCRAARAIR